MNRVLSRCIFVFISTLSLLFTSLTYSQSNFDDIEIEATAVKGPVYMLSGMGGNIGVSAGNDGILIIDDQFAPLAEKIAGALGQLGSDKPKYVINTHYHGDHTGANAFFHSHKGATIFAHDNVRIRLADDEKVSPEALPTVTYDNGIKLHFNGDTLHVIHFPSGHTDGDSVVWFEKYNVLHTGDLFFNGRFPYIDLDAGGSVTGYISSVKRLLNKINEETIIIPGHGAIGGKSEYSAFLTMIEETYAYVKAQKEAGHSLDEIQALGLDDKWKNWSWSFINEEKWIFTLYHGD